MRRFLIILTILFVSAGMVSPQAALAARSTENKTAPGYQNISETVFQSLFQQYLRRVLKKTDSDVALTSMKVVGNKPVQAGILTFQVFRKDRRGMRGNVRLTVIVNVDGVSRSQVRLSGWVNVFDDVVYTARRLVRGQVIQPEDVYLVRSNISYMPANVIFNLERVIGMRVKHSIKADAIIKEGLVERPPTVEKGYRVTILAESAFIKITAPGLVLMKGETGDMVRVRNLMSKKEIYAQVVDNATVRVDF